jgi:hypothetical protein
VENTAEIQEATKGLSEKQRTKVQELAKSYAEKLRRRGKEAREMARGRGLIFSSVLEAAGGVAAEAVRRKIVGRWTKSSTTQGAGLIFTGLLVKAGAKYLKIPLLHEIGGAHVSKGADLASMKSLYGEDDPVVIAVEGTAASAKKDDEG